MFILKQKKSCDGRQFYCCYLLEYEHASKQTHRHTFNRKYKNERKLEKPLKVNTNKKENKHNFVLFQK